MKREMLERIIYEMAASESTGERPGCLQRSSEPLTPVPYLSQQHLKNKRKRWLNV